MRKRVSSVLVDELHGFGFRFDWVIGSLGADLPAGRRSRFPGAKWQTGLSCYPGCAASAGQSPRGLVQVKKGPGCLPLASASPAGAHSDQRGKHKPLPRVVRSGRTQRESFCGVVVFGFSRSSRRPGPARQTWFARSLVSTSPPGSAGRRRPGSVSCGRGLPRPSARGPTSRRNSRVDT